MRVFRTGATRRPFYVWGAALAVVAALSLNRALHVPDGRAERRLCEALALACFILGPGALAAHLLRRRMLWVGCDRPRGLLLPSGRVVPWREIESVERRPPLFRTGKSLCEMHADGDWIGVLLIQALVLAACFGALRPPKYLALSIALLSFTVARLAFAFFAPLASVLSPWHARISFRLRPGGRLVLRDLEDEDEFLRLLPARVRLLVKDS
jgi:hypothetical protein